MNEEIEQIEEKYYNNLLILLNHKKVDITAYNILKKYDIKTILHNDKYIKKLRNDFIKNKYKDFDDKEFINIIEKNYYNQINKGQFMENLKYYSDLKGITPSKMAKKLEMPLSTVFDWYNGVNFPKVCHLYFLTRELNITYQDLLEEKMSEEEQKAMENDILFQIDMELYDKFNDKFCKMNEYLGEIYSYADLKDLEDSRNATEINLLRQAIVKQQKEIEHWKAGMKIVEKDKNNHIERLEKELEKKDKMIDIIIKHICNIIDNDDNASLLPFYDSDDNIEEKVKQYFEKKAEETN